MDENVESRVPDLLAELSYLHTVAKETAAVRFGVAFWLIGIAGVAGGVVWLGTDGTVVYELCWLLFGVVGATLMLMCYHLRLSRRGVGLGRWTLLRLLGGCVAVAALLAIIHPHAAVSAPWLALAGGAVVAARRWPCLSLWVAATGTFVLVMAGAVFTAGSGLTDIAVGVLMCACALLDRRTGI